MEELIPELKRELAIAVVCHLMDKYKGKPRPVNFFGKAPDSIVYNPELAYENVFSGMDSFYAFFEVLKSVKSLNFLGNKFSAYLDKDVCLTEKDPVYRCFLKKARSFVIKNLFKYTRRLELDFVDLSPSDIELIRRHFGLIQNLKELVVKDFNFAVQPPIDWLVFNNMLEFITSIEAPVDVFEAFNQFGGKYKLEKMVVRDSTFFSNLEGIFKLSNFVPMELDLDRLYLVNDVCQVLKDCSNEMLTNVRKFGVKFFFSSFESTVDNFEFGGVIQSTDEFVGLITKKCPVLEELELHFVLGQYFYLVNSMADLGECTDGIKVVVNSLEKLMRKRQKLKFSVFLRFDLNFNSHVDNPDVLDFMKLQFPDYLFSSDRHESILKKRCFPSKNSLFCVAIEYANKDF